MTVYSSAAPESTDTDITFQYNGRDTSGKLFSLFLVLPEGILLKDRLFKLYFCRLYVVEREIGNIKYGSSCFTQYST